MATMMNASTFQNMDSVLLASPRGLEDGIAEEEEDAADKSILCKFEISIVISSYAGAPILSCCRECCRIGCMNEGEIGFQVSSFRTGH